MLTASLLDPSGSRLANADLSSGVAAFSLPDLHGDLGAAELTSSTTVADAIRYDGYGQTIASGGAGGGPAQPYRYQGRLDISPDASQPVYDLGARFYQPSLGVFTQLDSVAGSAQDPLSLNRYLYAEANPATLIDPDGHIAMSGAGVDTSGTWSLATARVVQNMVAKHAPQRAAKAKPQPKQGSGFNLLGFLGTAGKVAWGVTTRQVSHVLELPGAAVSLAWRTPGAIAAAPGAIADAARNPGRAWNTVSTGAIVGFRDWTTSMHDNLVSGDPDRIAAGISGSIDVAWLATGVAGAGKAAASRVSGAFRSGTEAGAADISAAVTDQLRTTAVHGNSLASTRLTTLYRLNDVDGNLLKWGITSQVNPLRRYSRSFLSDKQMIPMLQGTRSEIARIERFLTERVGGPLNLEPWAGSQYGSQMDLVTRILESAGQ